MRGVTDKAQVRSVSTAARYAGGKIAAAKKITQRGHIRVFPVSYGAEAGNDPATGRP